MTGDPRTAAASDPGRSDRDGHGPDLPAAAADGAPAAATTRSGRPPPGPGHRLGDFELLGVLGTGSFATVFLARQLLGRQVALKVSANRSQEARTTLASLEQDHIVRVFAEAVDAEHDLRLLCMQYIPGTALGALIRALAKRDHRAWGGRPSRRSSMN